MIEKFYSWRFAYDKPQKPFILLNMINNAMANILMPMYYKKSCIQNGKKHDLKEEIIITLTTYSKRINTVHLCIESLLRQQVKADRVILWLALSEFQNLESLPPSLIELTKKGLEIRFCEDLKSYKKLYFAAKEFPNSILVTADDDFLYPNTWLEELISTHKFNKYSLVCHRAHGILFDNNNCLLSYGDWDWYSNNIDGPSFYLHPLTGAGILFPVGFFDDEFFNLDVIQKFSPTTDDLWVKITSLRRKFPVVKVKPVSKSLITISGSQKESLIKINQAVGNDKALRALMNYYGIDLYEHIKVLTNDYQLSEEN
ncbi:MAG: hypothetical protein ABGX20_11225 [Bacillus sp. (in: firmicutes)]